MSAVLITGGAGYIGSHAAWSCVDAGRRVVVVDDLSRGVRANAPAAAAFIEMDIADAGALEEVVRAHAVTAIMHFAGSVVVPESVERPLAYYANNTLNSLRLIEVAVRTGVAHVIFSSSAAVYAPGPARNLTESDPVGPINPYGWSKLMTEQMLGDAARAHGLRYAALRYFNVAGADPQGRTGQSAPNATHLIKVAAEAVVGRRDHVPVYGEDYDTPDGTCVRDYIHVSDLAEAHARTLAYLEAGGGSRVMNCGYGRGASVKEVLAAVERVGGASLRVSPAPRRPGDAPVLVADPSRLRSATGWAPRYDDLDRIVGDAIAWERRSRETTSSID